MLASVYMASRVCFEVDCNGHGKGPAQAVALLYALDLVEAVVYYLAGETRTRLGTARFEADARTLVHCMLCGTRTTNRSNDS
jgi:hypothetical protein